MNFLKMSQLALIIQYNVLHCDIFTCAKHTMSLLSCLEYNFLTHLSQCVLERPWATQNFLHGCVDYGH